MVTGANTTDFVLDGTMAVQELRNGTVAATYLTGPRGPEYRRDDAAGTVRWYVYDGLGSVVGEAAPDGSLTCTRKLDVYGCVRSSSGTATSKHKFVGSLGHPSDDETGLIYMRARHYDPVCGRFASQDPARNGANWFAYCGSDPTMHTDASGLMSFEEEEEVGYDQGQMEAAGGDEGALQAEKWITNKLKTAFDRKYKQYFDTFRDFSRFFHRTVKDGSKIGAGGADNFYFGESGQIYLRGADGVLRYVDDFLSYLNLSQ